MGTECGLAVSSCISEIEGIEKKQKKGSWGQEEIISKNLTEERSRLTKPYCFLLCSYLTDHIHELKYTVSVYFMLFSTCFPMFASSFNPIYIQISSADQAST